MSTTLFQSLLGSYASLYGAFTGAQAELLELNAEAVDGAIQAVLAALASGLTWAEVRLRYAALVGLGSIARLGLSNGTVHIVVVLCPSHSLISVLMAMLSP